MGILFEINFLCKTFCNISVAILIGSLLKAENALNCTLALCNFIKQEFKCCCNLENIYAIMQIMMIIIKK